MTVRHIFIMLEAYFFMLFCVPFPVICAGNAAGLIFFAALIVCTVYCDIFAEAVWTVWNSGGGKALICIFAVAIIAFAVYFTVLSIKMLAVQKRRPDPGKPCTVIILGCRVKGTRPTRMLRKRLEAAYSYMQSNPQSVCIVSGGQGSDEQISEAEAMRTYLLGLGVDERRIYSESRSVSTYENLKFSLEVIREYGLPERIAIATDGFHQYRASVFARRLSMRTTAVSSKTEPRYLPTYWVREWFGITQCIVKQKLK
jgi:uncharacterized SAM-binding protein YcdF (DUF218 family)